MAQGIFQRLEQSQKLVLAPILQQNIQILLLNTVDLFQEINKKIDENPFLELVSEGGRTKDLEKFIQHATLLEKSKEIPEDDFENYRKNIYEETFYSFDKKSSAVSDENSKQSFLENTITTHFSMYDFLKSQMKTLGLTPEEEKVADVIFSSIDEYGILTQPLEKIAEYTHISLADAERILKKIQELDPPGVGARDSKEFIFLQIEKLYGKESSFYKIAEIYFELFDQYIKEEKQEKEVKTAQENARKLRKKIIKEIARRTKYKVAEIEQILKKIEQTVFPNPNTEIEFENQNFSYIIPDIIVKVNPEDMTIDIKIFDDYLPQVRVNQEYRNALRKIRGQKQSENIQELKMKYEEAKNFVNILKRRNATLYDLTQHLVEIQKEFFLKGPEYIKPLTIKEMAEILHLHESTISRIVNNKYIATPFGVFPLKYLFSHHIDGNREDVSAKKVGEMIKKIIEKEGNNKKLSDSKITKILNNMGIKISRRTITKYRKKMNILSSFER